VERTLVGLLLLLIVVLYAPYVGSGGLLRDDLGFVTAPRQFPTYLAFQTHLSSFLTMTARPVSAVLHGVSYWFVGSNASAHHAINLSLFTVSVFLVYWTLRRVTDPWFAFLTCALSVVYPSASGTIFSATMMNSNLAAVFWAAALFLASSRRPIAVKSFGTVVLLVLSGLSYESFIPLFPATILVGVAVHRASSRDEPGPARRQAVLRHGAEVVATLAILGFYRVVLEREVFDTSFSRVAVPAEPLLRFGNAVVDGARVAIVDGMSISFRALRNIALIPSMQLLTLIAVVGAGVVAMYHAAVRSTANVARMWVFAVCLFLAAHAIYSISDYSPTAAGFESRTQGGIRFAAAFALAAAGIGCKCFRSKPLRSIGRAVLASVFALLAFGMAGQREGWIGAARHNEATRREISTAMLASDIRDRESITLVANLERRFPEAINKEPVFGTSWDLGPALELAHPDMRIRANVWQANRGYVDSTGLYLDGYWKATFPFYYYRPGLKTLREVVSVQDWEMAIAR
jgi:hypothetical protein